MNQNSCHQNNCNLSVQVVYTYQLAHSNLRMSFPSYSHYSFLKLDGSAVVSLKGILKLYRGCLISLLSPVCTSLLRFVCFCELMYSTSFLKRNRMQISLIFCILRYVRLTRVTLDISQLLIAWFVKFFSFQQNLIYKKSLIWFFPQNTSLYLHRDSIKHQPFLELGLYSHNNSRLHLNEKSNK